MESTLVSPPIFFVCETLTHPHRDKASDMTQVLAKMMSSFQSMQETMQNTMARTAQGLARSAQMVDRVNSMMESHVVNGCDLRKYIALILSYRLCFVCGVS